MTVNKRIKYEPVKTNFRTSTPISNPASGFKPDNTQLRFLTASKSLIQIV